METWPLLFRDSNTFLYERSGIMFTFKKIDYDYIKMAEKQREDILSLLEDRERLIREFEENVKRIHTVSSKTEP